MKFTGPADPALKAAVPDAPYVMEPKDFDTHDWKLENRPVALFKVYPDPVECCETHEERLIFIQSLANDEWIQKRPIIAYHNGEVLDGHHRIEVYRRCGVDSVLTLVGYCTRYCRAMRHRSKK